MAVTNLNSGQKLHIYGAMFRLNRSFTNITGVLHEIEDFHKVFSSQKLHELRGLAQEMQAEINHYLVENLEAVESRDWHRFGRVRTQRDKRLKE